MSRDESLKNIYPAENVIIIFSFIPQSFRQRTLIVQRNTTLILQGRDVTWFYGGGDDAKLTLKSARLIRTWSCAWIFDWRAFDSRLRCIDSGSCSEGNCIECFSSDNIGTTRLDYASETSRANQTLFHDIQATAGSDSSIHLYGSTRVDEINKRNILIRSW